MNILDTPSPNFNERRHGGAASILVLHYTGMEDIQASLARLRDPQAEVSAHYLVGEDGLIYRLVDEKMRAWHAGVAFWRGERDVNSHSIGIEIQNPGHEFGYRAFPDRQIDAVIALSQRILSRHPIPAANIVGHSDIAPDRKTDPGELFPWAKLAANGIGQFPKTGEETEETLDALLTKIGYDPAATDRVQAFQRRFRPEKIDGIADPHCCRLAAAYLSQLTRLTTAFDGS